MRMRNLWLVAVLGLIPSLSYAQTATVSPVGISSASINSSGNVVAMHTYRATYSGQPDSYYSRAVTYNKATTGKLGRARAFVKGNALNLGVVAATLAIGYALDEITKDIYTSPAIQSPYAVSGTYYWKSASNGAASPTGTMSDTTAWGAGQKWFNSYALGPGYRLEMSCTSNTVCRARAMEISPYRQITADDIRLYQNSGYATTLPSGYPTATPTEAQLKSVPATSATDTQVHDAIFPPAKWADNGYLGDTLPELLRDPVTGATEVTQEVQDVATQVQNQHTLQFNPTATPVTAPTVSPNYTTETNNPAPSGLPSFCSWATRVCDFFDWYSDEPPEPPTADWSVAGMITEEELEMQSYSSGLGNGSCPADESFSVYGVSLSYSYAPMCDLASTAKIFVVLGAYLLSIFIVLGIRR